MQDSVLKSINIYLLKPKVLPKCNLFWHRDFARAKDSRAK